MEKSKYKWSYVPTGGMARVNVGSGQDIAHLYELDQKQWTVLSCPVDGLEFDKPTLSIIDSDGDGQIHVNDVIAASKWLTQALKDPDIILDAPDSIAIGDLNPDTEEGAKLRTVAASVLDILGLGKDESRKISITDVDAAITKLAEASDPADSTAEPVLPFGERSEEICGIVDKIAPKMEDWLMRCHLAAFNAGSIDRLDLSADRIAAISDGNISERISDIAVCPIYKVVPDATLPIDAVINPAWKADFDAFKAVYQEEYPDLSIICEAQWKEITAKVAAYRAWKDSVAKAKADADASRGNNAADIRHFCNFLRLNANFYHFLRNFVTFSDFYSKDDVKAVFQAGKLYIDQRCCELCIEVKDMAKQTASAGLSNMFLIYCDCVCRKTGATKSIVAAMTRGDIKYLRVGKNALFYDRSGLDYDATVTKIIDNPISIRQAFFSPYIKFWNWCTDKLTKSAAEKDSKALSTLTENAESGIKNLGQPATTQDKLNISKAKAFDIAKFAGIFAAIGMAVGFISSAFTDLAKFSSQHWYNLPLIIVAVMIVISGPSVFLAWCKLRKRNLAPILNANGWAINAASMINVKFGATLTSMASFPRIELIDPIAAKELKSNRKKRRAIIIAVILLAVFAICYFNNWLAFIGLPY